MYLKVTNKMKTIFYSAIVSLMLLMAGTGLAAQVKLAKLATSGGKGIFVMTGEEIPMAKGPISGYIIERKAGADKDFREVAKLPAVTTVAEFKRKALAAASMLPYKMNNNIKLDSVWIRAQVRGTISKLGATGYAIPVLAGLNMLWLDENVDAGKVYTYRVKAIGSTYTALSADITYKQFDTIATVQFERGLFNQPQRRMELYWEAHGRDKPVVLEAYRSQGEGAFEKINAKISVLPVQDSFKFRVIDTTAVKGRVYNYYVKPYDAFGNAGIVTDTQMIASLDFIQMPMPEKVKAVGDSVNEAIHIRWTQHDPEYLNMLTLYRSTNSVDGFEAVAVLSPDIHEYIDQDIAPSTSYFYYFEVQYKMQTRPMRSTSFGASYKDFRKPAVSQEVEATAVSGGIQLDWKCDDNNISGFWVYRAERGRPMRLATKLITPKKVSGKYSFTDLDSSLSGGKFYMYALKTYSTTHLESSFSDTVSARPGKTPPAPRSPLNVLARQSGNTVFIKWDNVAGYDENTNDYVVLRGRKIAGTTDRYSVDSIKVYSNKYSDSLFRAGESLRYAVVSRSMFGSMSKPSAWTYLRTLAEQPVAPAAITINDTKEGVQLNWQTPGEGSTLQYAVYRYERGKQSVKAGTTASGTATFVDRTAVRGKHYFYFIRAVGSDKTESERSKEASINF